MMDDWHLTKRDCLPEELQVLLLRYPRSDWPDEGGFDELTGFWLSRHAMFRELIVRIMGGSEAILAEDDDQRSRHHMIRYTEFFLNQLHAHHSIEDQHYFPQFVALDDRLARGFDLLDSDHHTLDENIHLLAQTTNELIKAEREGLDLRPPAEALHTTQKRFDGFLNRHLTDEEELIVPLILEYGNPAVG